MSACLSFLSCRMTPCACRTFSLSVCRATASALLFTCTLFRTNGFTVAVEDKIYWKMKRCCDLQAFHFLPGLYDLLCNTKVYLCIYGDVRVNGKQCKESEWGLRLSVLNISICFPQKKISYVGLEQRLKVLK